MKVHLYTRLKIQIKINNKGSFYDKPTQALLYVDAVDLTLDTNPTFKWDLSYDGNKRVSTVERYSDTDLDGTFTYTGKYEYVYNGSGDVDSIPGYDNTDTQEV